MQAIGYFIAAGEDWNEVQVPLYWDQLLEEVRDRMQGIDDDQESVISAAEEGAASEGSAEGRAGESATPAAPGAAADEQMKEEGQAGSGRVAVGLQPGSGRVLGGHWPGGGRGSGWVAPVEGGWPDPVVSLGPGPARLGPARPGPARGSWRGRPI